LGEIEVARGGEGLVLPPSKKTRALLAYLVVTGRPHRRERLCSLLWDIPDDPRGALRWSLSKLRALVDEPGEHRIVADRETVAFDGAEAHVDLLAIRTQLAEGVEAASTQELEESARAFRGEFLEGLELTHFHDFYAWCVAEREEARILHVKILDTLVERLSPQPEDALPHARTLVHVDPFNESARATLVRLLAAAGRPREAEQQYQAGSRLFEELGSESSGELLDAWQSLREPSATASRRGPAVTAAAAPMAPHAPGDAGLEPDRLDAPAGAPPTALVGRHAERARLIAALSEAEARRRGRVILLTGEPGVGKTRLLAELIAAARQRGGTVLDGCAYEAESGRPYGPWIDALRRLPPVSVGETIGTDLAPLLPELAKETKAQHSRDRLFGAVVDLIAARAHSAAPVLLALDDVQWCDDASAELLHYVARMNRHRPVLVALAARDGELPDNAPMLRVLRGLRRDRLLDELSLGPLSRDETEQLVQEVAPNVDGDRVFAESAGNPLFALEVARSLTYRHDDVPQTLSELVRDRIDRLPPTAGDVLRWGAVLGQTFSARRLTEMTPIDLDGLMSALETLERHALLSEVGNGGEPGGTYAFAHDLVRRVVYAELSEPRRRLMHWRIAKALHDLEDADEDIAADIAHHAALAGEASMAARACVSAGHRCLRVFANTEAYALARRGMRYAEQLCEPERVKLLLELTQISFAARRPPRLGEAARTIEDLAERALDHGCLEHARLGFHVLSYLRWERGDWSDAQRHTMRAELVSRSADEKEQVVAMAEAARCLAVLERDLGQAEALLLEAGALSERAGVEPVAIPDAMGMLRLHQGQPEEAAELFQHARTLARRDGDRMGEFQALEHLVMLELQRERCADACALSEELVTIGDKLREGSEAPFARALSALSHYAMGEEEALANLEQALEALEHADAKHRLAYALTRAADIDLRRGNAELARTRAAEALDVAGLLGRPSEIALAHVALARAASALSDHEGVKRHLDELGHERLGGVSAHVRRAVETLLAEDGAVRSKREVRGA
jgi:DNA-binding SARP family transcriptional activator/tetratricopeptide (TPR) repeat protein